MQLVVPLSVLTRTQQKGVRSLINTDSQQEHDMGALEDDDKAPLVSKAKKARVAAIEQGGGLWRRLTMRRKSLRMK